MLEIFEIINTYNVEILLGMGILTILLLILNIVSFRKIGKIRKKYDEFVKGSSIGNVEKLLIHLGNEVEGINTSVEKIEENIDAIETKLSFAVQKVGFIRYNAFPDMGSELSYSIALLDSYKNGFVLTSIYGRDYTTSYAKPIKFGKSPYDLSVEENQAIDRAILGEYRPKTMS